MAQAGWMSRHGARGERWSSVASSERATKRCSGAGIPSMGFHEARHTYISWLVASGLDIRSVKDTPAMSLEND